MANLLIVDDETDIVSLVRCFAGHEGHRADGAFCGREALRLCRENAYDAIILDVMLPDMDGFSVCRELRALRDTPMLMLSARGEEYDKLTGFDCGADDYMVKPFSPRELMARIRVIVSRHGTQQAPMPSPGWSSTRPGAPSRRTACASRSPPRNTICSSIWP